MTVGRVRRSSPRGPRTGQRAGWSKSQRGNHGNSELARGPEAENGTAHERSTCHTRAEATRSAAEPDTGEGSATRRRILQHRPHPDGPAGRRRDEHARPGRGRRAQRGVALPLLPLASGTSSSRSWSSRASSRWVTVPVHIDARAGRPRPPSPDPGATPGRDPDARCSRSRTSCASWWARRCGARRRPAPSASTSSPHSSLPSRTWVTNDRPDLDERPAPRRGPAPAAPWWSGSSSSTPPMCSLTRATTSPPCPSTGPARRRPSSTAA